MLRFLFLPFLILTAFKRLLSVLMGAQESRVWDSTGTGDGPAAGYTELQTAKMFRDLFTGDRYATEGVFPGVGGELAVSGTSSPLSIASGTAMVYGFFYVNDAATTFAISSPVVGTTGFRLVLLANWSIQTVRITSYMSADGTSAIPGVAQTEGTFWDTTLATGTITTGGSITLTDVRSFIKMPTALVFARQGGSATNWSTAGTTNYTPGEVLPQLGVVSVSYASGTGTATVTFGTAYSGAPNVMLTTYNEASSTKRKILASVESVTTTTLVIRVYLTDEGTGSGTVPIGWDALGAS